MRSMNGVINIYKEKGYTSHDAVAIVRKQLGRVKAGHTGTLDPDAEGVLPICIGRATKLAGFLTSAEKSYRAELILGRTTDTYDQGGRILSTETVDLNLFAAANLAIRDAVNFFVGGYMQMPPMYSALKLKGKKLYELARAGKTVERSPRHIEITRIDIIGSDPLRNRLWLDIDCGKGTYIRSLCADIGQKLGCGACMGELIRTKSGSFTLDSAIKLSDLEKAVLISPEQAFPAAHAVLTVYSKAAFNGNPIPLENVAIEKWLEEGDHCWLYYDKAVIGLYALRADMLRPEVMMHENHKCARVR